MSFAALRERQAVAGATFATIDGLELIVSYGDPSAEYQAAESSAALYDASAAGRIWMRDRDRAALLHRLSTNQIEALQPGQGNQSVLTNHNGRIIDLLTVHALPDQLLLVTSPQQRNAVFTLLRKNIFFNDKVKLEQASDTLGQLALYGPASAALIQAVCGLPAADLAPFAISAGAVGETALWVARISPIGGAGFALYAPAEALPALWDALVAAGAQPLGHAAFDVLRVEMGYGAYERELSLEYIPLETGLWDAISFTKGCYVGQEIIARMESRNRLAKQLRGLRLHTEADAALPALPAKLDVGGKEAGDLTSVVQSPRFGVIGLAYVRTAYATPGATVMVAGSDVGADVVELPFQR